ncbi:MAG: CHAT domain-containing protein [Phormidesmis sp.]
MRSKLSLIGLAVSSFIFSLSGPQATNLAMPTVAAAERVAQFSVSSNTLRHEGLRLSATGQLFSAVEKLDAAALLYPLILEDRIELVLATGNSEPLYRTVGNVSKEQLNQAILDFQEALRDPNKNAIAPAQKLYQWLIEPIEEDLVDAEVDTILYAPDGVLRYIPLAALYDGEQWIAERFQINNITSESLETIGTQPSSLAEPRVFAGAFANPSEVYDIDGNSYRGLPFAGQKVKLLSETVSLIKTFLDKDFSFGAVEAEIGRVNILHFATHASFISTEAI